MLLSGLYEPLPGSVKAYAKITKYKVFVSHSKFFGFKKQFSINFQCELAIFGTFSTRNERTGSPHFIGR